MIFSFKKNTGTYYINTMSSYSENFACVGWQGTNLNIEFSDTYPFQTQRQE